ncbi:MAG: OadG family protein [Eubacterium sp.]|nr:OadG family protein [Eubacterium sp.]
MTTMAQAGYNTLLGMGTVFCVLILMSVIIYCFKFLPGIIGFFTGIITAVKSLFIKTKNVAEATPEATETINDTEEDETELVAVIAAAIAASYNMQPESFVVRSIKRRI